MIMSKYNILLSGVVFLTQSVIQKCPLGPYSDKVGCKLPSQPVAVVTNLANYYYYF